MLQARLTAATKLVCAILTVMGLGSGCYHYHIAGNRVTPSTEPRSATQVAYFWGLLQPNDIVPPNCPEKVPLAHITANTNFGYVLIGTVTLGMVLVHDLTWQCAKDQTVVDDVVFAPGAGGRS